MKAKTLKRSRSSDDEDRSRSKKPAKSSKRRRRRRRRDSGDDDRGRRRRRRISGGRHKNPGGDRRKEAKRAAPRRSRYFSSSPSSSSSSSVSCHSSRSCSTCHRRSVSSSPERHRWAKVRARSRSRGREKEKEKKRGRSRKASKRSKRSLSCSTCSRSPSRSCSGERRYKEESDRSRRIRLKSGANDAKDEERDKIIQAYDDFPSARSNEGFDEAKNEKEAVSKKIETEPTEKVDDAGIFLASEKSEIGVSFENLEAEDLELVLRQKALENFKKFRGRVPAKGSSGDYKDVGVVVDAKDAKGSIRGGSGTTRPRVRSVVSIPTGKEGGDRGDSVISPRDIAENSEPIDQINEVPDTLNQFKRLEGDYNQMPSEQTTVTKDVLRNKTAAAEHGSSVGKTLEGPASGTSASVVTKVGNEAVVTDTTGSQFELKTFSRMHDVPDTLNQLRRLEGDNNQMPSEQTTVAKEVLHNKTASAEHGSSVGKTLEGPASGTSASVVTKVGNEAVVEDTTGSQFEQKTFSRMHDVPDTLNQLKRLEGDNNQMPSEQTTVTEDVLHNKTAAGEHGSSVGKTLEGPASGTSASVVTKVGNEAAVEDTTGSQFEQKTFSRMHDGEMVQVSYKVYIPKKTPALARRQLQR